MKTTIEIADALFREAKEVAACEGTTLRALIEDGLRTVIASRKRAETPYELPGHSFGSGGLRDGLTWADWPRIRDLAYGLDVPESVIALDTNILVYAHREDSPFHDVARNLLADLARSKAPWAIPWPCVHEFLAIVTNPGIFRVPTPPHVAEAEVAAWAGSASLRFLAELDGYVEILLSVTSRGHVVGGQIHDAHVAALCIQHGVDELWTADREFARFPDLPTRNPLLKS